MERRQDSRFVTAAASVAGVGWLVVGPAGLFLSYTGLVLPPNVTRLVLPETVPINALLAPGLWPVVIPLLSALTLAAFVVLFGRMFRAGSGHPRVAFAVLWLAVILSASVAAVLWSIGMTVASWPPQRAAFLFDQIQPALVGGAFAGFVWGWLPALVGTLVFRAGSGVVTGVPEDAPVSRSPKRTRGALLPVAVVASLGLVASAIPVVSAYSDGEPTYSDAKVTITETPIGSSTVGPVAQGQVIDPGSCTGDQVSVEIGIPDGATGHRAVGIRLTNTGSEPCVLNGYPDLAFDATTGWAMDVMVVHGGSFATEDTGAHPITLEPGAAAQAALGWDAQAAAGETHVGAVLVAPFAGALRQPVAVDLDITDGGVIAVTAWEAATY